MFAGVRSQKIIKNSKGFSLIEVLVALSVMMGAFVIIATAWSTSQIRLRKMKLNHQVSFLLDYKLADVERQYRTELTLLPEEDAGNFEILGADYKDFTWKLQSKKFELPDLTALIIQQKGSADATLTMMMNQLSDYFNQAVKEVTVTVIYTYKKKNVEYTATTFLIDYNQQLPLPNMGGALPGGTPDDGGGDGD